MASQETPKITLYTSHLCPYAHRAHITLEELGLPYDEVLIDLSKPREPSYLEVNPRGLVPSLRYESSTIPSTVLTESAIVSQFLVDAHVSHLLPSSTEAPLQRARINFFVDTFNSKVNSFQYAIALADSAEAREAKVKELVQIVAKEVEPLLPEEGQGPFFGGSEKFTFAETQVAPFLARIYGLAERMPQFFPPSLITELDKLPKFKRYAAAVRSHPSVNKIFPLDAIASSLEGRIGELRAKHQAAAKV